jgi:hypothetical protein
MIKNAGRQRGVIAEQVITFADFIAAGSGVALPAIDIPGDAIIDKVRVFVDTAFNSGTSDVVVVGDGNSTNRLVTSTSIQAAGSIVGVAGAECFPYIVPDTVDVIWTGVGTAPTAGSLRVIVFYHESKCADFTQR